MRIATLVVAAMMLVAAPVLTFAQDVAVAGPSLVGDWWQAIWNDLRDPIITLGVGVVVYFVRQYLGTNAAEVAQRMLQGAAERYAGGVINELGDEVLKDILTPDTPAVKAAVEGLRSTMAETIVKAGSPNDLKLAAAVINNIGKLTAPTLALPVQVKEIAPVVASPKPNLRATRKAARTAAKRK